jgi:hypothetical protein
MAKYNYLKKYVSQAKTIGLGENGFGLLLDPHLIEASEKRLGFEFPSELKEFWREIGPGVLRAAVNSPENYRCAHNNTILDPYEIANILLSDPDSPDCPVIYEFYDMLEPGDMPFFEIGDSVSFLYMRPKSEKPNAVYDSLGNEVSPSFEEFIHRLYYESPTFYLESDSWGKLPQNKPASNG